MDFETENMERLTINGGPMGQTGSVTILSLPLGKIKLGNNSRMDVSDDEIAGLMQSIREVGLLQPIGVVKNPKGGYEICYGNRRYLACLKLGVKNIPAVLHTSKREADIELKNLTENIQRRNISLVEAGRYMEILRKSNHSIAEIAVRLGVSKNYVDSCLTAYNEVPKEFRNDLEVKTTNDRTRTPGKISIGAARSILNAEKNFRLDQSQVRQLFSAAKSEDSFNKESVNTYAAALKAGKKDFLKTSKRVVAVGAKFLMTEDQKENLMKRFVYDGPYKSLTGLFADILRGKRALKIDIV